MAADAAFARYRATLLRLQRHALDRIELARAVAADLDTLLAEIDAALAELERLTHMAEDRYRQNLNGQNGTGHD